MLAAPVDIQMGANSVELRHDGKEHDRSTAVLPRIPPKSGEKPPIFKMEVKPEESAWNVTETRPFAVVLVGPADPANPEGAAALGAAVLPLSNQRGFHEGSSHGV